MASVFFYLLNWFAFKINNVKFVDFSINGIVFIRNQGSFCVGKNIKINSGHKYNPIGGDWKTSFIIQKSARLSIGENVGISNSTIYCSSEIEIGNNVLIGGGCKIWDTNFHSLKSIDRKNGDCNVESKPIKVHDDVFIGGGTIILKGCEVGKNVIIGAGSVVTKSIPQDEIWGGNPAKFIRKNE